MKKNATARPAKAASRQSTLNFPTSSEADLVAESAVAETSTKLGAKNRRKRTADFADDADKPNESHCDSSAISAQSAVKTHTPPTTETVPKNWRLTTISEIAESLDNRRVPVNKAERAKRHGPIPYYGANGQVGWIDDHIFDEPLVLVVEDETFTGRTLPFSYVIRGKAWVNNHAHVLRAKESVTTEFLNYSLSFYPFTPLTTGSTGRRKLTKNALMSAPYMLPPLPEQHRIVAEIEKQFTRLDAGVAALKRVQANLKRYRAAVLNAACEGKLVPTEAKLRRTADYADIADKKMRPSASSAKSAVKTPPFETGEQLLRRILTERRQNWQGRGQYKEPEAPDMAKLLRLPEGWGWAAVGQVAEIGSGNTPALISEHIRAAGPIPWFKVGDMNRPGE